MPNLEFDFSSQDSELILSQVGGNISELDYVRLIVLNPQTNQIVSLNPSADNFEPAIFYSSLSESPFVINTSPFTFTGPDVYKEKTIGGVNGENNDFKIFLNGNNINGQIFLKPNEIFDTYGLPQGSYILKIDFLNQINPQTNNPTDTDTTIDESSDFYARNQVYQFIIKEISTSRKEIRLKLKNNEKINVESQISENLTNEFNKDENGDIQDKYQFRHVLNFGTDNHIPIMNFAFDEITDGKDNQSLILKLYEPIPSTINTLSMITIEREVLTTQTQQFYYFSDVPPITDGSGLIADAQENWINPDGQQIGFQSIDELAISASIGDVEVDTLISASQYGYPNLNTNFNEFENHTFFGSAKNKLENFRTKVETIQGY